MFAAAARRWTSLLLVLAAALLSSASVASADVNAIPAPAGFRAFAPDSIFNQPLRAAAPLSPDSAIEVSWLVGQIASYGAWINTTQCGMPLYWAAPDTPTVTVTLDHPSYQDPALMDAWAAVPIPADAVPANCGDRNFSVAQVQPDGRVREWELWAATKDASGQWSAQWGGAMDDMRTDRGIASQIAWQRPDNQPWEAKSSTSGWNVTASSISQNAGVITPSDLRSGHIDHAVAIALHDTASGRWLWPAQRSDGGSTDAAAIPEGAHLRLDPSLDLSKLAMTPLVRMVAEAAQRYGIVVRDRTYSSAVFYTEPPVAGQPDPTTALLDGQRPDQAFTAFPWASLQLLAARTCTQYPACNVTDTAVISSDATATVGQPVALDTSASTLNQPRKSVDWDLNGDGIYETHDTSTAHTWVPTQPGTVNVGVRITTLDGTMVTATQVIVVAPSPSPASWAPAPSAGSTQAASPPASTPAGPTSPVTTAAAAPSSAMSAAAAPFSAATAPAPPRFPIAPSTAVAPTHSPRSPAAPAATRSSVTSRPAIAASTARVSPAGHTVLTSTSALLRQRGQAMRLTFRCMSTARCHETVRIVLMGTLGNRRPTMLHPGVYLGAARIDVAPGQSVAVTVHLRRGRAARLRQEGVRRVIVRSLDALSAVAGPPAGG